MPSATTLTPVLDRLRDGEQAQVLHELLGRHPQLHSEAEQVAIELLREVTVDAVTDRVTGRLTGLELADLGARAGRVPGGYVEPGEAASELVEGALASVESDLGRCIDLGLRQAARQILLGLITGMHRCSNPPEGTVLAHAGPDTLTEHTTWLVDQMQQAGLVLDVDELQERCPGWF